MKKIIRRSILSLMGLAALTILSTPTSAQQSGPLKGVWSSQVTLTDCQGHTLTVFSAFVMYNFGGTLTSTDNAPPTTHGPGLGTWRHLGGRTYSAPFQFFNFNADGTFAGVQKIEREIVVSGDGNSYTSTVTFGTYDPNGTLVFSGCGSEIATRLP